MSTHAPSGRHASIDVLRAIAIVLMVLVHFVENLSGVYGAAGGPFLGAARYWWLPTGFAAPLFTFLSGVSYRFWLDVQKRRGRDDTVIAKATIRRGLFLMLLGFAFNVLVWLPEDVFNWDILTCIGFALIALDLIRRLPTAVPVFMGVVVVAMSPILRSLAGYSAFWTAGYFDYDFTITDVILGFLVTGYFPLFPWIVFPIAGFVVAPLIDTAGAATARPRPAVLGAMLIAASLAVIALPAVLPELGSATQRRWTMFPASTAYVLGTLGVGIVATSLLHRVLDAPMPAGSTRRPTRWLAWSSLLSRHSLSIYLLHHAVHVWPLWITGLALTGEPASLWQNAMPAIASAALAAAFMVLAVVVFTFAERHHWPTAESVLRWLCD